MNIKVVYRKDARNSQGKVPLIIRFTHRRQTKTLSTGIIVDPSVWDENHNGQQTTVRSTVKCNCG